MKRNVLRIAMIMLLAAFAVSCACAEGVGGTVTFGSYPQGAGGEVAPIEWTVLDIDEDGYCVLISVYALDAKPYNEDYVDITWEECTLRTWLNGVFFDTAFSAEEQEKIKTTHVVNTENFKFHTSGGSDTEDKVYLLSLDEITLYYGIKQDQYRDTHPEVFCLPTEYAAANGAWVYDHTANNDIEEYAAFDGNCWWWLRSSGDFQNDASSVRNDGTVSYAGYYVYYDTLTVRPVIRVRFD